ncbi:hypothetical protein [Novosphingobium sp.]|uniref:hypothetical protein n=1 Tax=Novosphingobium sp. TaxID=1874826 RepID=UPI003BA8EE54
MIRTIALGCLTYLLIADVVFSDILKPVSLAVIWSDRLSAPYWRLIVLACFAVGALGFLLPDRVSLFRVPVFLTVGLLGSLLTVGAYADHLRSRAVSQFGAERQIQHAFLTSVRKAPADLQFFLHAAVLKRCEPYGWSYRTMNFYRIPPNVAVNVLPPEWITECSLHGE